MSWLFVLLMWKPKYPEKTTDLSLKIVITYDRIEYDDNSPVAEFELTDISCGRQLLPTQLP